MSKDFQSDKKVILVIDDDIEIIELLKMFLDLEGYAVVSSTNGMDGIKMAESNNDIDLVILDVGLPDISGQQVCKIIRQKTDIPVIMLSANDSVSDKVICLEYGAMITLQNRLKIWSLWQELKLYLEGLKVTTNY